MNPNNYFDKTADTFIAILEGRDEQFNKPQRRNPQISLELLNKTLIASGLEPENMIYVPSLDWRQEGWRNYASYQGTDPSKFRDPKQPFIYRVNHSIYWSRGPSYTTGEGPKPDLDRGIDLLDCEFTGEFTINHVKSKAKFLLRNCSFRQGVNTANGVFSIRSSQFKELIIINDKAIQEQNQIGKIEIIDFVTEKLVLNGLYIKELIISGRKGSIQEIIITNCEIDTVKIIETPLVELSIITTNVLNDCIIGSNLNKLSLVGKLPMDEKKHTIDRLKLSLTDQTTKAEYYIREATFRHLELSGRNTSAILIQDCSIKKLHFYYFTNTGELRLHTINKILCLSIKHSIMGKALLSNLDWQGNAYAEVEGSLLTDIILINSVFPKDLRGRSKDDFKEIHGTLRQLKYASSQTGNRIQELVYEAREMDAFQNDYKTLKSWDDYIILLVNRITNNHGQSWIQALVVLALITTFTFINIKRILGYTLVWGEFSTSDFSDYLEFAINPLHEFDKVFKSDKTITQQQIGYAKILDILSKIFGGIILFQLVRAFRKYARSDAG